MPARREDFCNHTKSKIFALPFCGHLRIENLPVAERALVIWPDMMKYVDTVSTKKLPKLGTRPPMITLRWQKTPLILAQHHFFIGSVSKCNTHPFQIPA